MLVNSTEQDTGFNSSDSPELTKPSNVLIIQQATRMCFIILAVCGILGNALVLIVIKTGHLLHRSYTNYYIANQSLIDGINSIILLLSSAVSVGFNLPKGIQGELICRLWVNGAFMWSLLLSSNFNIMTMTLERYWKIVHPISHKVHFNKHILATSLSIIWFFSLIWQLPISISTTKVVNDTCMALAFWPSQTVYRAYGIANFFVQYGFPVVVVVFFYGRMAQSLFQRKVSHSIVTTEREARIKKAQKNIIRTLLVIVVCFALTWSLNEFMFFLFILELYTIDFSSIQFNVSVILVMTSCCINPVIYLFSYKEFQKALRDTCSRIKNFFVDNSENSISAIQIT